MDENLLKRLLKDVTQAIRYSIHEFEKRYRMHVTQEASWKLESPVHQHPVEIGERIQNDLYTVSDIGDAIIIILQNARERYTREEYRVIDVTSVEKSMNHYCPILFWC